MTRPEFEIRDGVIGIPCDFGLTETLSLHVLRFLTDQDSGARWVGIYWRGCCRRLWPVNQIARKERIDSRP